jgi:hypothetical protein
MVCYLSTISPLQFFFHIRSSRSRCRGLLKVHRIVENSDYRDMHGNSHARDMTTVVQPKKSGYQCPLWVPKADMAALIA